MSYPTHPLATPCHLSLRKVKITWLEISPFPPTKLSPTSVAEESLRLFFIAQPFYSPEKGFHTGVKYDGDKVSQICVNPHQLYSLFIQYRISMYTTLGYERARFEG